MSAPPLKGTIETILVVDDNEVVLKIVVAILKAQSFQVLSAENGPAALKLAEKTAGTINLLLSDVEMPGMSGPALGDVLTKARPDMHVMLMSGWLTGNLPVFSREWAYIQKPFVPVKLVQMVNEVLHAPNRSQPGGPGI